LAVSAQAFDRSLAKRVRLNRAILNNKYWLLPVDDEGHEDFTPVGRGDRSSDFCGKHMSFVVCKNVEGHEGLSVGGVNCSGKVVVRHKHMWCHKSTCPVCFIRGWSVRGAQSITGRLEAGVERGFGEVEHIVVSISPEDYDLPEKVFRKKARQALSVRGVIGVKGCDGFDDMSYQQFLKDGYYVKVCAERETVFGSAWYLLNHATVRVSFLRRFHAVTWWGVCGNRKYGSVKVESEDVCPACGEEMVRCAYVGKQAITRDIGDVNYKSVFVDDEFDENGEPNYVEVVGSRGYG